MNPNQVRPCIAILAAFLVFASKASEAPVLLSPFNNSEITDVATYFRWLPVEDCSSFEIEIARDSSFNPLVVKKRTQNKGFHKNCYFPKDVLPAGEYHWRVRTVSHDAEGPWSEIFRFKVNERRTIAVEMVRKITPERPLFLMRSRTWDPTKFSDRVQEIIPNDLSGVIIVDDLALAHEKVLERAHKYQELGLDFVIWNNRCQVALSTIEYVFQHFTHCIGTAEGEHFSGMYWEKGPEGNLSENDFVHRAWDLCAKYGRFYFFADGDGGSYRWPAFAERERENLERYQRNIVTMFKTTNGEMALHSYGAVQGLMASGYVENCGIWVDEWIWPCSGFGKMGEIIPEEKIWETRRKLGTKQCPWIYDIQMWLMGIASGSTVFHLESAHQWTPEGMPAAHYKRIFLPFVNAVVKRKLIPSRESFLQSVRLAVQSDTTLATGKHHKQYTGAFAYLKELYELKAKGDQEFIPNNSRYGMICLLPPRSANLNKNTQVVPQADLADVSKAREIFAGAYPQRFTGDAFMWECDRTLIVTNTCENEDRAQQFSMPLVSGLVSSWSGTIGVHQYIIGKVSADGRGLWFQANSEDPLREIELTLGCQVQPTVTVTPAAAATVNQWDAEHKLLKLRLSAKNGAIEVEVQ